MTRDYKTIKKDWLKRQQETILNREEYSEDEIDTFSSDYVICPYCGNALDTDSYCYEEFPEASTEGSHKMTCHSCGKDYELEVRCSWDYENKRVN